MKKVDYLNLKIFQLFIPRDAPLMKIVLPAKCLNVLNLKNIFKVSYKFLKLT
jgi:hypothetical protein